MALSLIVGTTFDLFREHACKFVAALIRRKKGWSPGHLHYLELAHSDLRLATSLQSGGNLSTY
jgi:hypothetical protein